MQLPAATAAVQARNAVRVDRVHVIHEEPSFSASAAGLRSRVPHASTTVVVSCLVRPVATKSGLWWEFSSIPMEFNGFTEILVAFDVLEGAFR